MYSDSLGLSPGAVVGAASAAKKVWDSLFGGSKPLLYAVAAVREMIADLDASDLAELDDLARPFGWFTGSSLNPGMADKITAELRDARSPAEQALFSFVVDHMDTAPADEDDDFFDELDDEVTDAAKRVITRRAANDPRVQRAGREFFGAQLTQAAETYAVPLAIAGLVAFVLSMRPRR